MQILKDQINNKIIKGAIVEFLDKGFEKASMRDIAKSADISTSNLYNYFKNKEELFNSIVKPVFYQFEEMIKKLSIDEKGHDFKDDEFLKGFAELATIKVKELIKKNHYGFILLMDCSNGTRYKDFKNKLIGILEGHFLEHIKSSKNREKNIQQDSFIMHVIATNLIEGLLEIARHYKNDKWVDDTISSLMNYHLKGIGYFF